jgi:hypothetical protein
MGAAMLNGLIYTGLAVVALIGLVIWWMRR